MNLNGAPHKIAEASILNKGHVKAIEKLRFDWLYRKIFKALGKIDV